MLTEINDFYDKTIKDFIILLTQQYQFRDGMDNNNIDKLEKRMYAGLKNSRNKFHKSIQAYDNKANEIQPITKIKNIAEVKEIEMKSQEQYDSEDDLKHFIDVSAKVEKKEEKQQIKQPIQKNYSQDSSDESNYSTQVIRKIRHEDHINMHIIGTYDTKTKKFVAKQQKTKIHLENVFIKLEKIEQEMCFQKLICEFVKIDKSYIKL